MKHAETWLVKFLLSPQPSNFLSRGQTLSLSLSLLFPGFYSTLLSIFVNCVLHLKKTHEASVLVQLIVAFASQVEGGVFESWLQKELIALMSKTRHEIWLPEVLGADLKNGCPTSRYRCGTQMNPHCSINGLQPQWLPGHRSKSTDLQWN